MSNPEQILSTGIGATIGFFIGGPAGALAGAQYGLLAGSLLFPGSLPSVQGPRLEDFERLHADPGSPIPIVWGTAAVAGFRLYLGPVTEIASTEEVGGKGGPSQEVTTFTYLQTLAIGLCEGPIRGVLRIWENGTLMYDVRPQQSDESDEEYSARVEMSAVYQDSFVLYLGDDQQLPDPTIEAEQGAGHVPGFRGLAYIVFPNRELKADQGNRHPIFKIELSTVQHGSAESTIVAFTEPTISTPHEWTVPEGTTSVSVLVVGGGGGGARTAGGGGGGAGEFVYRASWPVVPGSVIPIVVGQGGGVASNGNDSSFGSLVAKGGGRGGSNSAGVPGGSGGGGSGGGNSGGATIAVNGLGSPGGDGATGSSGGRVGGGGGGAGGPGQSAGIVELNRGGNGGPGVYFGDVFGDEYGENGWFCGGGGGAGNGSILPRGEPGLGGIGGGRDGGGGPEAPIGNTGGGGGGPYAAGGTTEKQLGDSGIVIIKYTSAQAGNPDGRVTVGEIVNDICARSGLNDYQFDVSSLEEHLVRGYVISRETSGRSAIEPLRMVGHFDIVESNGRIVFPLRGRPAVATLSTDELGVHAVEEAAPSPIETNKLQDYELPRQVRLKYPAFSRDYENGEQLSPARHGTVGVNDVSIECPVVLDDDDAAQIVEVVFREAWASRHTHRFTLGPERHAVEPADPLLLPVDGRLQRVRVVNVDDSGLLLRHMNVVRDDDGSYVSIAIATTPPRPPALVELIGDTNVEFLDLPALRDEDDNAGFYLAAWRVGVGRSWAGARIHRSIDDGSTYQPVAAVAAEAIVGTVNSAPVSGDGYTWDEEAEITVTLETGELENRNDLAVLNGANAAAIGAHGRWQIIQFARAELIGENTYRLTRLLLGRRGTEHLIGTTENGDRFVLISGPGIVRMPLQTSEIGAGRLYRAVSVGRTFEDAEDESFSGQGQALECFSPVFVRGSRDGSGNLTVTWLRRDRLSQTLRDGVPVPNSESSEAYEIDVMDGDTVVRTIDSLSTAEAVYSAADQTVDFGAPQASVTVRVYQLSATVGRGQYSEATV